MFVETVFASLRESNSPALASAQALQGSREAAKGIGSMVLRNAIHSIIYPRMIFAALDYWHYLKRAGRFDGDKDAFAGLAHMGHLSDDVLAQVQMGDCLVTQRLDSKLSWAMMWFTSSQIDHSAIYIGNGRIAHVTLAGFKQHSIRVLGRNTRILPIGIEPLISLEKPSTRPQSVLPKPRARPSHIFPPKAQLAWIAARIILGFHHERFRWKFILDTLFVTLPSDMIACTATGLPLIPFLSGNVVLIAVFNRMKSAVFRMLNKPQEVLSHPDILYHSLLRSGCTLYTTIGPIVATDFGLLPLKIALSLYRECADDGADDEL
jgi:hypothetical protein